MPIMCSLVIKMILAHKPLSQLLVPIRSKRCTLNDVEHCCNLPGTINLLNDIHLQKRQEAEMLASKFCSELSFVTNHLPSMMEGEATFTIENSMHDLALGALCTCIDYI
ncbi:hypothetical protein ACTXT7_009962 [Hymenolepis weldensis]